MSKISLFKTKKKLFIDLVKNLDLLSYYEKVLKYFFAEPGIKPQLFVSFITTSQIQQCFCISPTASSK